MMTRTLIVLALTLVVALGLFALQGRAAENARLFIDAVEAYRTGDYDLAVQKWSTIAATGIQNGELYYNLGNAFLKNEQLGEALLWYERALRLLPNDPDLRFNYDYARSLTQDAPDQEQQPLERIIFFWKYRLSPSAVAYTALVCNLPSLCHLHPRSTCPCHGNQLRRDPRQFRRAGGNTRSVF